MCLLNHQGEHPKMKKKFTIIIDDKVFWLLKEKQAEMILEKNKPYSFSCVVNTLLKETLKVEEANYCKPELDLLYASQN